jgi:hypothetical protein
MHIQQQMDDFVERLGAYGVAKRDDLRGCSAAEIAALESKYSVLLPLSYTCFLQTMGHASGKLGRGRCWHYADVWRLTEEERASWERCRRQQVLWERRRPENTDYSPDAFPHNGLIVCLYPGLPDFWLIVADGQPDSPVIHFDYEEEPVCFTRSHNSFFEFLEMLLGDLAR